MWRGARCFSRAPPRFFFSPFCSFLERVTAASPPPAPGTVWFGLFSGGFAFFRKEVPFISGRDVAGAALFSASLAVFYFRSFSLMHEAVHGSITPRRRWNDWIGLVYGVFCFLPFEHWRDIHLLHHQWAGNVE